MIRTFFTAVSAVAISSMTAHALSPENETDSDLPDAGGPTEVEISEIGPDEAKLEPEEVEIDVVTDAEAADNSEVEVTMDPAERTLDDDVDDEADPKTEE